MRRLPPAVRPCGISSAAMVAPVISPNNCASTAAPRRHAGHAIRPSVICARGSVPVISVLAVSADRPIWAKGGQTQLVQQMGAQRQSFGMSGENSERHPFGAAPSIYGGGASKVHWIRPRLQGRKAGRQGRQNAWRFCQGSGGRYKIRTCDPCRVKAVLYR